MASGTTRGGLNKPKKYLVEFMRKRKKDGGARRYRNVLTRREVPSITPSVLRSGNSQKRKARLGKKKGLITPSGFAGVLFGGSRLAKEDISWVSQEKSPQVEERDTGASA